LLYKQKKLSLIKELLRLTIQVESNKKKYTHTFEKAIIPKALKDEFSYIAKQRGVCKSDVLRSAIRNFIKENR